MTSESKVQARHLEKNAHLYVRQSSLHQVFENTESLGRAGILMGLEVSRLARNSSDWHRLLEICALADTLVPD